MTSPKAAKALQGLLPTSRLVTLAGSGHALMAERPDGVLDVLREFAARGGVSMKLPPEFHRGGR
jgi:pimeloyl-ACP methyl ester carboxylesterase